MSTSSNPLLDALKNRILKEIVKENEEKKDEKLGSENTVDERGEKRKMKEKKEEDADDEAEGEDEEKPRKKKKRSLGSHRDTKDQQYVSTFSLILESLIFLNQYFLVLHVLHGPLFPTSKQWTAAIARERLRMLSQTTTAICILGLRS